MPTNNIRKRLTDLVPQTPDTILCLVVIIALEVIIILATCSTLYKSAQSTWYCPAGAVTSANVRPSTNVLRDDNPNRWKTFVVFVTGHDRAGWRKWLFRSLPLIALCLFTFVAWEVASILLPPGSRLSGLITGLSTVSLVALLLGPWPSLISLIISLLIMLVVAIMLRRSVTTLAIPPRRAWACLLPILFLIAGLWTTIDTIRICLEFDGERPCLIPIEKVLANEKLVEHLIQASQRGDERSLDMVTSDLDDATNDIDEMVLDQLDPITVNRAAVEWTIALTVLTAAWWWRGPSSRHDVAVKISVVVMLYLFIGVAFGVLYYDYYVMDIAKQNLVAGIEEKVKAVPPIDCKKTNETKRMAGQDPQVERLAGLECKDEHPIVIGHPISTLRLLRMRYWSSSVFAEDKPIVALDSDHSLWPGKIFECSFGFASRSHAIVETDSLIRPTPAGKEECDAQTATTNGDSKSRLQCFLQSLSGSNYPLGLVRYSVAIFAGADAKSMSAETSEVQTNAHLAHLRAVHVQNVLRQMVRDEMKTNNTADGVAHLEYLAAAIDDARLVDSSTQATSKDGEQALYWPENASLPSKAQITNDPGAEWRAARLEIWKSVPDRVTGTTMSMGLAPNASLADMLYFSFASFTTTGYGDIKPVSDAVRFWAMIENILEILFTAVFFASAVNRSEENEKRE